MPKVVPTSATAAIKTHTRILKREGTTFAVVFDSRVSVDTTVADSTHVGRSESWSIVAVTLPPITPTTRITLVHPFHQRRPAPIYVSGHVPQLDE